MCLGVLTQQLLRDNNIVVDVVAPMWLPEDELAARRCHATLGMCCTAWPEPVAGLRGACLEGHGWQVAAALACARVMLPPPWLRSAKNVVWGMPVGASAFAVRVLFVLLGRAFPQSINAVR